MPAGRPKYNFNAVSNRKEVGIFTNWTQASDSVLGFANAKYKGYITYREAKSAMESAGIYEFHVFDGQITLSKSDYEKQVSYAVKNEIISISENESQHKVDALVEVVYKDEEREATTVFIDGSCLRNGSNSAKAGYGVYWGVDHPYKKEPQITKQN